MSDSKLDLYLALTWRFNKQLTLTLTDIYIYLSRLFLKISGEKKKIVNTRIFGLTKGEISRLFWISGYTKKALFVIASFLDQDDDTFNVVSRGKLSIID